MFHDLYVIWDTKKSLTAKKNCAKVESLWKIL